MVKKILIAFFLFTVIVNLFAQNPISRDEAYKIILEKGLVDTFTNDVKVHQQIIPSKTVLDFMGESMISPEWDSWFF